MKKKTLLGTLAVPTAAAVFGIVSVLTTAGPASAATTTPFSLDCQSELNSTQFTLTDSMTSTAPTSVAAGATFAASGSAASLTVPASIGGLQVQEAGDLTLQIQVNNATILNQTLSGGTNLGTGTPSITRSGNVVTLTIPGPLAGGSLVKVPTINFTLKAGASGGVVSTQIVGSSYDDPGLNVTSQITQDDATVTSSPAACFATDSPLLSSTHIN
ncbi:dehydratase [Streptomyces sp. DvalAA-14]|uniref:hypothetical protein n=1 Tax=unclassified Streptomyces TaxID=2593676 RepID=UPI00081B0198|nr:MULTISPECIES: hypothetical protein [unclassified Streptomyces]MYS21702.1 hypothetical protein [Streptomyces sp. SID4948]SCD99290.1 dehydratase [Streptomyces sp. DvalAA-14]